MSKDKPVKVFGRKSHYVVTKQGGWACREEGDSYIFTGTTTGTAGPVDVTVTVSRKTGKVTKTECVWTRTKERGVVQGNKVRLGDAVVLNAVDAEGNTLARSAVIYNEFKL